MSLVARGSLVSVIVALLAVAAPGASAAGADIGQYCFSLLPFTDTLRLGLTTLDGSATLVQAAFRWRNTTTAYQALGTGLITESLPPGGGYEMALVGSHNNGALFGGNKLCSMFARLSPLAFGGPWQVTCTGGGVGGAPFTASGTLSLVSCTAAADVEPTGRAMGQ